VTGGITFGGTVGPTMWAAARQRAARHRVTGGISGAATPRSVRAEPGATPCHADHRVGTAQGTPRGVAPGSARVGRVMNTSRSEP
jgi:hypothetical protein